MIPIFIQGITNPVLPEDLQVVEDNPLLGNTISAVVGIFLVFGSIFALFHLLFGAFRWITASGDKTALQNAQDRITQALVGLIIMAAVWAFMMLVSQFLGIDFPNISLPTLSGPGQGPKQP